VIEGHGLDGHEVRALEASRHRLNTLILLLPGQWFGAMAIFWGRYLPPFRPLDFQVPGPSPLALLAAVAVCAVPAFLPAGWFRPRGFERGGLYPALGLRAFRFLATDGGWINGRLRRQHPGYRVVRDRKTRDEHIAGTIPNERWHLAFFLAGLGTTLYALGTAQYGFAAVIGVLNVAFNFYPVLHQRYKRARLRRPARGGSV
jgi:hypothetical protein